MYSFHNSVKLLLKFAPKMYQFLQEVTERLLDA